MASTGTIVAPICCVIPPASPSCTWLWRICNTTNGAGKSDSAKAPVNIEPENLCRVEGSLAYPSYLGGSNFSCISLQNLANRLQEKQWVGSARRLTRLAGTPPFDDRVNLLPRATILHINTLPRPAGLTRSTRDSACSSPVASSWLGQIGQFLFLI